MSRTIVATLCSALAVLATPDTGVTQEKPEELTEEQRDELKAEAERLSAEGLRRFQANEPAEALGLFRRELELRSLLHGGHDHPSLVNTIINIGALLQSMGRFREARPYCERALQMCERLYPAKSYPDGHPDLAMSLINMGNLLLRVGEYNEALLHFTRTMRMYERLYPVGEYPDGHLNLANSVNNVGTLLWAVGQYVEALSHLERALRMKERLYPEAKFPDGHPDLASTLSNIGGLLEETGEYEKALPYHKRALRMKERLYPREKYPDGHPDLAMSLNNMAQFLVQVGEYGPALTNHERALRMYEGLYPREKYPDGHPDLAMSLNNMGRFLEQQRRYGPARPYLERAMRMYERLYPEEHYPDGHPQLAVSISNMGNLLVRLGEHAEALPLHKRAQRMMELVYPPERYPDGHPYLARSISNTGFLLMEMGEYEEALKFFERTQQINEQLYPPERYPDGHPNLVYDHDNMGSVLRSMGEYEQALSHMKRALELQTRLTQNYSLAGGLTGALSQLGSFPDARSKLLSDSRRVNQIRGSAYRWIWARKAVLARLFRARRALALADKPGELNARLADLAGVQRQIGGLLLKPVPKGGGADRDPVLEKLTEDQRRLEAEIARLLPEDARPAEPNLADLTAALRPGDAFIDLYRYHDWAAPEVGQTDHYVAFVVSAGREPARVELGPAEPIDEAARSWLETLTAWEPQISPRAREKLKKLTDEKAAVLRTQLWEPIAEVLPNGTERVYISTDSDIARVPFAALPGEKPGTVLLEEYAFATVESGPFLLEYLRKERTRTERGTLLAAGGINYGGKPDTGWPSLEGSAREMAQVIHWAGDRETVSRTGSDATTDWLLKQLPSARYVHLATHGEFRAKEYSEERRRFERATEDRIAGLSRPGGGDSPIRADLGVRNPLSYVGLVMAGANDPPADSPDRGILSGTSIWPLDLSKMELAVLSACETGLGEHTGGAGVQNLALAFHVAGCDNVIASLWKVDDKATAALMAKFYHELWVNKKPPIEALREAQLLVYRRPNLIGDLAGERGAPKRKEALQADSADAAPEEKPADLPERTPPKLWAAFTLSGVGK